MALALKRSSITPIEYKRPTSFDIRGVCEAFASFFIAFQDPFHLIASNVVHFVLSTRFL